VKVPLINTWCCARISQEWLVSRESRLFSVSRRVFERQCEIASNKLPGRPPMIEDETLVSSFAREFNRQGRTYTRTLIFLDDATCVETCDSHRAVSLAHMVHWKKHYIYYTSIYSLHVISYNIYIMHRIAQTIHAFRQIVALEGARLSVNVHFSSR